LKGLPGVAVSLKDGDEHGFAYLKERADLMAIFFGEYLTYHHTGKAYASAPAVRKPASAGNVITDRTLAEKKASAPAK
jgi:hypothetical protein